MDYRDFVFQQLPSARTSLRVAVVTETYPPEVNGVAMTISRMLAGLQQHEHDVQLIRPRQHAGDQAANESNFEEVLQRGVPIPRYDSLKVGLPAKHALVRLWSHKRPDLVHIVTEGPLGWSALSAAARLKIPSSSDFHTNFHIYMKHYGMGWLRKPVATYLRKFHNRTQATLVPTRALMQDLQGAGYLNLRVVSRGVDTRLFHPQKRSADLRRNWGLNDGQPAVLYVGRLAPEKNLKTVLETFAAIRSVRRDARLVLVGDGPERAALQAADRTIHFAGMRTGEALAAHYASGDVFLFPSVTETFGNVTVEAMASGLAVVAYNYAAAAEHIEHHRSGLLARLDDAKDFKAQAMGLIGDARRIVELGRRARKAAQRIDWKCVLDEFEHALTEVIIAHDRRSTPNEDGIRVSA